MTGRLRAFAVRLVAALTRRRGEADVDEELASHLQLHVDDNLRRGMTPQAARRDAVLKLGGLAQARERVLDRRGLPGFDALAADVRYACRLARSSPAFTAAVVLTIAVGTGANAAMFSLVDEVLLRPLPVDRPRELVSITTVLPEGRSFSFSYPMYRDLADDHTVFAGVVARGGTQVSVSEAGRNEKARAELVSGNYFQVLGVRPAVGRLLTPEDDRVAGAHPVVVLSYAYWQRRFGGDPSIVGRTLLLNEHPMTVVGVTAPRFYGTDLASPMDVQIPLMQTPIFNPVPRNRLESRRHQWLTVLGRLQPGVSRAQAQASADVLARRIWEREAAAMSDIDARNDRLAQRLVLGDGSQGRGRVQGDFRLPLLLLLGVTTVVLMVVCTNIANLLLARAAAREGELAMRVALGASRARLVQQAVAEGLVFSVAGAAAGAVVAYWCHTLLVAAMPDALQANLDTPLGWRAVALLGGAAVLLALIFGIVPALRIIRANIGPALRREYAVVRGSGVVSLRGGLVVTQVALAVPLLVGAALLGRSLVNLMRVDLGFRPHRVLVTSINPGLNGYTTERARLFYRSLLDDLRAAPAVEAAALTTSSPISGGWDQLRIVIEGYHPGPGERITPMAASVSDGYFAALGIPVVAGREFTERDRPGAAPVAVVNETMARAYFGDLNPIGRHIGLESTADIEIVGVVRDAKYVDIREATPRHFYIPAMQEPRLTELTVLVRTASVEAEAVDVVRRVVGRLDPHLPVFNVKTLDRQIDESMARERITTWLCAAFSVLATFLAALGLYGVVTFSTVRRVREFGLRIALGAGAGRIIISAVYETVVWLAVGLALGTGAAFAARRATAGLLYGVSPTDPAAFALGLGALVLSAGLAAYLPARRATRVDPVTALRCE